MIFRFAHEPVVERLVAKADHITLVVRAVRRAVPCPRCAQPSSRIHSYYERRLADLPWNGIPVEIRLGTRRFFCDAEDCARHIFAERLPETTATYARRTLRMEQALRWLALALGGEAGARTAQRLGLGISGDTLLRHLRRMSLAQKPAPVSIRVLGMDDWAWRKGQRYGTILCDLERHRVVDLLPAGSGLLLTGAAVYSFALALHQKCRKTQIKLPNRRRIEIELFSRKHCCRNSTMIWMTEYPSQREASYYRVNPLYVEFLLNDLGCSAGRALERTAHYLMSCMPGPAPPMRPRRVSPRQSAASASPSSAAALTPGVWKVLR